MRHTSESDTRIIGASASLLAASDPKTVLTAGPADRVALSARRFPLNDLWRNEKLWKTAFLGYTDATRHEAGLFIYDAKIALLYIARPYNE
jgi:hypothetical protein